MGTGNIQDGKYLEFPWELVPQNETGWSKVIWSCIEQTGQLKYHKKSNMSSNLSFNKGNKVLCSKHSRDIEETLDEVLGTGLAGRSGTSNTGEISPL